MFTQRRRLLPALAIAVAIHAMPAGAQRPATPTVIPVFPGAQPYEPERAQVVNRVHETLLGLSDGIPLLTSSIETWVAQVSADKVDAFYRAKLGGIASNLRQWQGIDPRTLAPGRATAVHQLRYDEGGSTRFVYEWYSKDANGDIGLHELAFQATIAADPRLPQTGPLTMIELTRKTFSRTTVVRAPDEATLGVPVYPGATYDANASTNTLGALFSHVFLSTDATAGVVAFYERACGSKAQEGAPLAGGVTWVVKPCTQAFPDDYILVEPAERAGTAKTRIIIHLVRYGPPDLD